MHEAREVVLERHIFTVFSKPNIAHFQRGFPVGGLPGDPVIEVDRCRPYL